MLIFKGLSGRITIWFMAIFIFVAFVGWHQLRDLSLIHDKAVKLEQANHQSHYLHELETSIRMMIDGVRNYLVSGAASQRKEYRKARQRVHRIIKSSETRTDEVAEVERLLKDISLLADQIFSLPFSTGNMEGPILMQEIDNKLKVLSQSLSGRHHEMDRVVNDSMHMVSGLQLDMRYDVMVSLVLLFALLLGLSIYLYSKMIHPLIILRRELARIGRGDFSPDSPDLGNNELGELSLALNSMGQALMRRDDELVRAKSLAAHQEKMHALGLMTASIAHEVGNPLSAASILLDLARHKLARNGAEGVDRPLEQAVQELRRTEMIISNVLNFGRHSSNDAEAVDIESVISSAVQLVRLSSKSNGVQISFDVPAGIPRAWGNVDMLRQVLVNLLLNAMDACQTNGEVFVKVFPDGDCIYVDVVDQGEGVPDSMREEVFSPLFSTKPKGKGTGLGLSISRDLMKKMFGGLELVESGEKGCRFRLSIPVKQRESHADTDS